MQTIKNGGLPENWIALFISIAKQEFSTRSLQFMGVGSNKEKNSAKGRNQKKLKEHVAKVLTRENLEDLYIKQDLSYTKIAKKLNIAHSTVGLYLKKYGISKEM